MVRDFLSRGLLYWLRAPREYSEVRRDEWVLAIIRIVLGACFVVGILHSGRTGSLRLSEILLFSFLAYSLIIALVLRVQSQANSYFHIGIHYIDILWTTNLILLVQWPSMSFALFFFMMASAAGRWGFWEAQLTNLIFCAQLVMGIVVYNLNLPYLAHYENISGIMPEVLIYFAMAFIVGLLAEVKSVRSERYAIANILQGLHDGSAFEPALRSASTAGLQLYGATQILVAIHERSRKRSSLFRITNAQRTLVSSELGASELPQYFFPCSANSWRVANLTHYSQPHFRYDILEGGRITRKGEGFAIPDSFLAAHPFRLLLAASLSFEDDVTTRLYVIDPEPLLGGRAGLRFLERALSKIAPLLHNLFLVSKLKTKAEAAAGGRMARNIHDGIIQSLCLINQQLEELRAHAGDAFANGADPLASIQQTVMREIADLRKLTEEMRSLEIDSSRLLGYLAGLTMKFHLEHGIAARFVPEVDEVHLPQHTCVELARIAQEALINVHKHSRASEVLVRFGRRNGDWVLHVADNGCGFGFAGRLTHEELQASGRGPIVIMERAHGINAKVNIECFENGGSCLEIALPHEDISC
jgi:signal transduction histidine kinase